MAKVAYVKHPVSPELKKEINDAGFKIIDAAFAPEGADIIDPHAEAEDSGKDDQNLTKTAIKSMGDEELDELLKAHGVEDPQGNLGEKREQLIKIVFVGDE